MDPSDFERGLGPVAVAVAETSDFCRLMYMLANSFADPEPLDLDFRALNSRSSIFNADDAGAGGALPELYVAGVLGFTRDVLTNEANPHYMLASTEGLVRHYVEFFEVVPDGLDLLKYSLAFGVALSMYFKNDSERHILSALARMRTLRVMCSAASDLRPDQAAPAAVMVAKLQKAWKEEEHERLTGLYGTYMLFKTWSLPGEIGGTPAQERDEGQPDRAPVAQRTQRLKWFSHPRATSAASGAMRANISVS
ncbi:hypothetical protein ACQ86G_12645 [Roseateles chitinivorans]|uniref:hypothetical protein n=1 Tax=Roseateles chitinivorans TaxID=2917965 RepID=UPI003D67EB4E